MSKINLRKQTSASVSNPGAGQLSIYFDPSGIMTSKDEAGAIITYGTLSGLITEIDNEISAQKGIANGIASLGADAKIPAAQLPAQAVTSVNGYTGAVVLGKADVGLSNVLNLNTSTTANITDSLNKRFITDAQLAALSIVGKYSNVSSGTVVNTPVNSVPTLIPGMTLIPGAGTHKVTFNGQYSATAASITSQTASDLTAALNAINAMTATGSHILVFGNETITPGVYDVAGAGSITATTTVTLDGQGNANSIFIFRMAGAFSTGSNSNIVLINGAQASNVFWVPSGAVTIGTNTTLIGTVISLVAVSTAGGCNITGRLSSTGGAVSITTSTIAKPTTVSQITLGSFAGFAMFTNSGGVSAGGACTVTGDVGTNVGTITGFETSTVNGNFYTSASISSILTLGIYNNGVLVPISSRSIIDTQTTSAAVATLDAIVTTIAGQSVDIRIKIDSGTFTTGNRTFTTVQVG